VALTTAVQGALGAVLAVLDHEPVDLAGRVVGLRPHGATGSVMGTLALDVPLTGPPSLGRLGLRATASVLDAVVPQMPGDWALAGGSFDVAVDDRELRLTGHGMLRDVPAEITLVEPFAHAAARRLQVVARLEAAQRKVLGMDLDGVEGPLDAIVQVGRADDGTTVADVEVDLRDARLALALLALDKAAGDPGRVSMRLIVSRGVISRVERFDLAVGGTSVRGQASRPPAGGFWSTIDAEATWASSADEPAGHAVLVLRGDGGERWQATITSPSVGDILAAHGMHRVRNGSATFDGLIEPHGGEAWIDGTVRVKRLSATEVSWLVRVIALASLEGLTGRGRKSVEFDDLTATVSQRGQVVTVTNLKAVGSAFTVVLDGTYDRERDALDVTGTLVPSYYRMNEGVDRIPMVGGALGHLTGGAIQGVTFVVRGPADEPEVSVRPLSSLAPGALRELLQRVGL
jgi:hypothetical protein